jgi:hypothetical protein
MDDSILLTFLFKMFKPNVQLTTARHNPRLEQCCDVTSVPCTSHEDSIIIVQEGELTRCPNCRMFVKVVTPRHVAGSWCRIQAARLQERERVARLANMARNIKFYINDTVIENVTEFKYLGWTISADDYDDGAVNFNITKASKTWYSMYQILSRDTADSRVMARFYVAVIQAKLLYGSETWVFSQRTLKRLESFHNQSFHNRCARIIAHRPIHPLPGGTWEYPPTEEVLDFCGLSDISTYIARCKTRLLNRYAEPA